MRYRLCWIPLSVGVAFLITACGVSRSRAGSVRIDLRKFLGQEGGREQSQYIWLKPVGTVVDLPKSVKARIGRRIVDPGGPFNKGDVNFFDRLFGTADRRLLFAGVSDKYCLMHYEYGGIAYGYRVVIFELSKNGAVPIWSHAGRQYANLADFADESDPDALENQVENAIL